MKIFNKTQESIIGAGLLFVLYWDARCILGCLFIGLHRFLKLSINVVESLITR